MQAGARKLVRSVLLLVLEAGVGEISAALIKFIKATGSGLIRRKVLFNEAAHRFQFQIKRFKKTSSCTIQFAFMVEAPCFSPYVLYLYITCKDLN